MQVILMFFFNICIYMLIFFSQLNVEWEKLNKVLSKSTSAKKEAVPRFYIRVMVQIEDFMKKTFDNKDRKMNSINAKSLNTMKQKLKKWLKTRPDVEKSMEDFRKVIFFFFFFYLSFF